MRLCDPAVGSGHFLVSALNELILLKYELGILVDATGKRIRKADYQLAIENDELIVTDTKVIYFLQPTQCGKSPHAGNSFQGEASNH